MESLNITIAVKMYLLCYIINKPFCGRLGLSERSISHDRNFGLDNVTYSRATSRFLLPSVRWQSFKLIHSWALHTPVTKYQLQPNKSARKKELRWLKESCDLHLRRHFSPIKCPLSHSNERKKRSVGLIKSGIDSIPYKHLCWAGCQLCAKPDRHSSTHRITFFFSLSFEDAHLFLLFHEDDRFAHLTIPRSTQQHQLTSKNLLEEEEEGNTHSKTRLFIRWKSLLFPRAGAHWPNKKKMSCTPSWNAQPSVLVLSSFSFDSRENDRYQMNPFLLDSNPLPRSVWGGKERK